MLCEFVKRMNQQFLAKEQYKSLIRDFFLQHVFTVAEEVKGPLAKCLALYVEKMHEEIFFENLIYPEVDRMDTLSE